MISNDEDRLITRLLNGETIHCLTCKTGIYIPAGKKIPDDVSKCRCFVCNSCKERININ